MEGGGEMRTDWGLLQIDLFGRQFFLDWFYADLLDSAAFHLSYCHAAAFKDCAFAAARDFA